MPEDARHGERACQGCDATGPDVRPRFPDAPMRLCPTCLEQLPPHPPRQDSDPTRIDWEQVLDLLRARAVHQGRRLPPQAFPDLRAGPG